MSLRTAVPIREPLSDRLNTIQPTGSCIQKRKCGTCHNLRMLDCFKQTAPETWESTCLACKEILKEKRQKKKIARLDQELPILDLTTFLRTLKEALPQKGSPLTFKARVFISALDSTLSSDPKMTCHQIAGKVWEITGHRFM